MPPVAVVTDSTHYLPRSLADSEGISQVSLYVGWKDEPQRELQMGDFDGFYERLRKDPELPTTSQPSIGDFLAVWEPLLEAGRDVVSLHLAGGISGTVEAARQAHGMLSERGLGDRVEVRSADPSWLAADLRDAGAQVTLEPDGTLGVVGLGSRQIGELAAERGHVLHQLRDVTASLEEAYFRLTGESVEYRAAAPVVSVSTVAS